MRRYGDDYLCQFIDVVKKYYLLESLKLDSVVIKNRGSNRAVDLSIFDKFEMSCNGKESWEIAAHYGESISCVNENINKARLKIQYYLKLFVKGIV